jgi:uncharacterized iron-regulated protein
MSLRIAAASRVALMMGLSLLTACAVATGRNAPADAPLAALPTAYDYQLLTPDHHPTSLPGVVAALQGSDVVFIGEYHGNHASHLLEMQLLTALHRQAASRDRGVILSMEMFNRDQQAIVDDYRNGKIGERYLIKEAPAWHNYTGSYRPLVEYAKAQAMPIIAANAPGDIVRCIGRQGEDYIPKLTADEKTHIATQPFAEVPGYADKFFGVMGGSDHQADKRLRQSYLAQLTRDNTMAESIARAHAQSPQSVVVHLNGSFHSEGHLGTVGALKRLNPDLKISVITPIRADDFADAQADKRRTDEFYYLVNAQPAEFVDDDYKRKMRGEMFSRAREKAKGCR